MATEKELAMQRRIGYMLWIDNVKSIYTVDATHEQDGAILVVGTNDVDEYEITIKELKT